MVSTLSAKAASRSWVGGTQQAQLQHGLAEAVVEQLHVVLLHLQLHLSVRSASL